MSTSTVSSGSSEATIPPNLPQIADTDSFVNVVKILSDFFLDEIPIPMAFEALKAPDTGYKLALLVDHLVEHVRNPALINAILTLKWHFSLLADDDHHGIFGIHETRANACEIIAWRFLSRVSEREAVDFCLYTLPLKDLEDSNAQQATTENTPLLPQFQDCHPSIPRPVNRRADQMLAEILRDPEANKPPSYDEEEPTSAFIGLNGLEIAAAASCKHFLGQHTVHKIVCGIWNGDIAFWDSLTPNAKKKAHFYIMGRHEHFLRLRVPKYIKAFEVIFFALSLFLFYAVLEERDPYKIYLVEYLLYIWFAAFAYDELGEFLDAGGVLYSVNAWNMIDLLIILIGIAFIIIRMIGLYQNDHHVGDIAFNVLSLESLFMIPRIASLLSLLPYFGTLLPCLKQMTLDFFKFMGVVGVIYLGFLSTFALLARKTYSLGQMVWFLTQIFLGSSTLAWEIMHDVNHIWGPPLMIIFVVMTKILLLPALITILHATFAKNIANARLEYLFVYSVYTLEVSTRNRLTHFYPPLNLIPLFLVRPLRLIVPTQSLRIWRIWVLKITHLPIVGAIILWDKFRDTVRGAEAVFDDIDLSSAEALQISRKNNRAKPFLTARTAAKGGAHHLIEMPSDSNPHTGARTHDRMGKHTSHGHHHKGAMTQSSGELEVQIKGLVDKVGELTVMVEGLKGNKEEDRAGKCGHCGH